MTDWRTWLDEVASEALAQRKSWEEFALACRDSFFTLALIRADNNKSNAARSIGITRNSFSAQIKNRGIRRK